MAITLEELRTGPIDLSRVVIRKMSDPVHPGVLLKNDLLDPLGIDVRQFAEAIKIPLSDAEDIVQGRQAITAETALRLGHYFGGLYIRMRARFWLDLQNHYDLKTADPAMRKRIEAEVAPRVD